MILNGKLMADTICTNLKSRVDRLKASGVQPELVIVTSGDNDAGSVYVRNKVRRCEEIGITATVKHFQQVDAENVKRLCGERKPIIFQMPMTGSVTQDELRGLFTDPMCDVDGFVADFNVAALASGSKPCNYPCTPKGIIALLDLYGIKLHGMNVCMIGRSNIVGRPLARMLEQRGATVTVCHRQTDQNYKRTVAQYADIIISAAGERNVITERMFSGLEKTAYSIDKKILIDVGMNRDDDGKLCGDFSPELYEMCKAYTPVPGGVGPMTVAMLMENVVEFYERGGVS